jgi:uncharacterized protein with von Willebrand factor type A (vWA) domain
MKINAVDLSAKLLATENISVRRARTQTASFDVKSRVLTLPMWKEMSPVVEGMLVGHEVGHALYTTEEYFEPIKNNPKIMGYLNILEDVRIEKLIKRKYPGIRKTMSEGYKELNEKDFFGVQKSDMNAMLLIDKINLYFKAGYGCGVKFSIGEKNFVDRAERTETVDDVLELANEIYAYSREELRKKIEQGLAEEPELLEGDDDFGDLDEIDEDFSGSFDDSDIEDTNETSEDDGFDNNDKKQPSLGRSSEEQIEQKLDSELETKTDKMLSKKLEELADDKTEILYYQVDDSYTFDPIVPFKKVISETTETDEIYTDPDYGNKQKETLDKFKLNSSRIVNYLIKEFEMRKSATLYKRAQTSKIGQLDMRKVWSYKLNDDLFKRVTTIPQGKNHGMVFLLDWSGSMQNVIQETIEQVVTLAMFCHRAQIPYQVFAFSSQYDIFRDFTYEERVKQAELGCQGRADGTLNNGRQTFALLELLSNKMSSVEFNTMVRRLLCFWKFQRSKSFDYSLSGTPLNEALAYMLKYIPKFVSANNVEKLSFITLTDGEGSPLYPHSSSRYALDDHRYVYDDQGKYTKIQQKHFLVDPVTKKTYNFSRYSNIQTESLIRMIKDRYGVTTVGFYVTRNHRNDLQAVVNSNIPGFNGSMFNMIENMRKDFRDQGFSSIKNSGRDDLFIIPINSLKTEDAEVEVEEKHTAKQIARQFTKVMSGKKTSRVLLNQFIGYVA